VTSFRVDDVRTATEPLPTRRLADVYDNVLVLGGDPDTPLIEPDGVHPLLDAVSRAFVDHRPLVLSPDAVWLTIAQGVAQHIRLNAEELRPKLVGHAGREALTLSVPSLPADPDVWHELIEEFGKEVAGRAAGADLFECDFTTSTCVERTAGRIVLLDGYSPYFSYWLKVVCGIPRITLTGTVEDWRKIRARVDRLSEFGLEKWVRSLAPIADEFVRAADGDPNLWFWQRIYNPADAYGGAVITGWIARFLPLPPLRGRRRQPESAARPADRRAAQCRGRPTRRGQLPVDPDGLRAGRPVPGGGADQQPRGPQEQVGGAACRPCRRHPEPQLGTEADRRLACHRGDPEDRAGARSDRP
jgi:hypothetical protein